MLAPPVENAIFRPPVATFWIAMNKDAVSFLQPLLSTCPGKSIVIAGPVSV